MSEQEDLEKAREVIKDQERMLLEYGSNNKKLLDETDALKRDVQSWKDLASGFDADIKTLKQEKAELEDDLKNALIKPASELAKGQIIPIPFDSITQETCINAINYNAVTVLMEYHEGISRLVDFQV